MASFLGARMLGEEVNGLFDRFPSKQGFDVGAEQILVERVGMVEV